MPTSLRLEPEAARRLDRLVSTTGRSKAYYLREMIERGLEDMEDYYLGVEVRDRVGLGQESTRTLEAVELDLGLAD